MSKPVLAIVIGSTRPGRVGPKFAAWFRSRAIEHGGFEVELVDLAALKLPFLDEPGFPRLHQYVHEHTINWGRIVDRCDAFVFVPPRLAKTAVTVGFALVTVKVSGLFVSPAAALAQKAR